MADHQPADHEAGIANMAWTACQHRDGEHRRELVNASAALTVEGSAPIPLMLFVSTELRERRFGTPPRAQGRDEAQALTAATGNRSQQR